MALYYHVELMDFMSGVNSSHHKSCFCRSADILTLVASVLRVLDFGGGSLDPAVGAGAGEEQGRLKGALVSWSGKVLVLERQHQRGERKQKEVDITHSQQFPKFR
jgi:hypothetical protein